MSDYAATPRIRPYRDSDWDAVCRVHDAARVFELTPTIGMDAFIPLAQAAENEGLFDGEVAVLEADDIILGFAGWKADDLTWLYVDPAHFGKGYGRTLLRHVIECGGPKLRTEVLEGNLAAETLYLREGFVVKERTAGRLAGNEAFAAVGLLLERVKQPAMAVDRA
jgi:GNAT superfamily N-acetyltransferase